MNLKTFTTEQDFIAAALEQIGAVCRKKQGKITIALSGGSTPRALYQALAHDPQTPFNNIEFFQVDERYVPPTHADSNQKLIRETLLSNPNKQPHAAHFFNTALPIEESLKKYENELSELPQNPFDLIILGIGPDGHTASLFPGLTALHEDRPVAYTTTNEFTIFDRLTLTFSPILKAKKLLVLLKGSEKQTIIDELREGPLDSDEYPAKRLMEHPRLEVLFYQ